MAAMKIEVSLRIESTQNMREHWSKKAKRAKTHRHDAWIALRASMAQPEFPTVVKITRIAPRKLDDDNLAAGCKNVRDGVADWLGVNDNDSRVQWTYAQEKRLAYEYAVRIELCDGA